MMTETADGAATSAAVEIDLARRMDFVRQVQSTIIENIRIADTKAGAVAAASAALLNVLGFRGREVATTLGPAFGDHPVTVVLGLALFLGALCTSAAALVFTYFALRPRFKGRPPSWVAFSELARMTPRQYIARIEAQSDTGLIEELARDTVELAAIALRKNQMIERAIPPLILSAVGVALFLLVS